MVQSSDNETKSKKVKRINREIQNLISTAELHRQNRLPIRGSYSESFLEQIKGVFESAEVQK